MNEGRFIFDAVREFAKTRNEHTALIYGDRSSSYGELARHIDRVANGLVALGLKPGSRVAVLTGNNDYFFEIWLGAALAGFVLTPINARLAPDEVLYIVNDSQAQALFVDEPFHSLVENIAGDLSGVRHIFALDRHPEWPSYVEWRDEQSASQVEAKGSPADTMVQMYTSGTTGFPKGVELNHSSVLACARGMMGAAEWQPGEVVLVTAPLFHTAGSAWSHCALQSGGTVVLLPELSPASILTAFETYQVTEVLLVPAVIQMLLQSPDCAGKEFSSLRRILYGASPISVPVLRQAIETFGCEFEQGYGLTETVGPIAMLYREDHLQDDKLQSCGKPIPGNDIRVVDSKGNDCRAGDIGEIVVSGVQVMNGYWKRPDDTRAAIREGWFHTGDLGYFDADGYLYIHDRLKDMILSGAENVYPAEVERVLQHCPGIAEVAVIGVPDARWGEAVKAVVVAEAGASLSEKDVIDYARSKIAAFKCPKSVDFVDAIPRNPSGKILKKVLREPYWEDHERRVS
ncbi:MAG: long-chain-fatty-acid--CoA ligase [Woeseiaceae bacterium]|nr:long-chain-fatty-acid--CoA ligase [Woeseiaceae bacterium]